MDWIASHIILQQCLKFQRILKIKLKKNKVYKVETLGYSQGGLLTHKLGTNSLSSIQLNPAYKGESQSQNE